MASDSWTQTFLRRIQRGRIHRYRYCDILRIKQNVPEAGGGKRGMVEDFSKASARRFRMAFETRPENFTQFVTLTFPREIFAEQSGLWQYGILRNFVRTFWQEARKIGEKYLWVVEAQRDGTPHFHVLVTGQGERFALEWKRLVWLHLGYRHEAHEEHGVDVRPVTSDAIDAYLAKTSRYMAKTNQEGRLNPLLNGWRRWGRNYVSEPWAVEEASAADISIGLYATALQKRPNALTTWLVCSPGVLIGADAATDEDPYAQEVPNVFACSLQSGARRNPFSY